jgi:NTE family protein
VSGSEQGRVVPVLAGGGTRLPAHIGILAALETLGARFGHLVGVSGGSIIAALYAAGHSLEAIRHIAFSTDFRQFRGYNLYYLLRHGGLSNGNHFQDWMDRLLRGSRFEDLDTALHIVATDLRTGSPVVFDRERSPGLKVSEAVRFSMSIPLVFSVKPYGDRLMTDGSVLSEDALHRDWSGQGDPVLCFRLRGSAQHAPVEPGGLLPVTDYVTLLIRTFMTTISREYVSDTLWHNTIIVECGDSSPVNFSDSVEQKEALFRAGYDTALEIVPLKAGQRAGVRPRSPAAADDPGSHGGSP